jgi:hypothetical protein
MRKLGEKIMSYFFLLEIDYLILQGFFVIKVHYLLHQFFFTAEFKSSKTEWPIIIILIEQLYAIKTKIILRSRESIIHPLFRSSQIRHVEEIVNLGGRF